MKSKLLYRVVPKLILCIILLLVFPACSTIPSEHLETTGHMPPPPGLVKWCKYNQYIYQCQTLKEHPKKKLALIFNDRLWKTLTEVKTFVNKFEYKYDRHQYGISEFWQNILITGKGDCEDYAIAKQQLLIEQGIPHETLGIATAYTKRGYHAVLVVSTDKGHIILDNNFKSPISVEYLDYDWVYIPDHLIFNF